VASGALEVVARRVVRVLDFKLSFVSSNSVVKLGSIYKVARSDVFIN